MCTVTGVEGFSKLRPGWAVRGQPFHPGSTHVSMVLTMYSELGQYLLNETSSELGFQAWVLTYVSLDLEIIEQGPAFHSTILRSRS